MMQTDSKMLELIMIFLKEKKTFSFGKQSIT